MTENILVKNLGYPVLFILFLIIPDFLMAQSQKSNLPDSVTVEECLRYAMEYQPLVRQLKLDEKISDQNIKISLSDWLPQINSSAVLQHYLKQPVSIFPNFSDPAGPKIQVTTGVKNNSNLQLSATQNIFTNDLYFAGRTSKYYRRQVSQTSQKEIIQLVVDIRKAFYDVLLSRQMLNILDEEISRLTKSLNDALALYKNGTTDKIDYSRATMSLNNAKSQKISVSNSITAKMSYLKQLMGFPDNKPLALKYNFSEMQKDIQIDTLQGIVYNDRIEYKLLQTDLQLQQLSVSYYRQSFIPSLSGFINYNVVYQNDNFGDLYKNSFPNSLAGLTLSFPIFEGTRRLHNLKKSKLSYDRMVLDTVNMRNEMSTEYITAVTSYKSNLVAYKITQENMIIASDVYNTVKEQYNQGIKAYLEVIISETDLRQAQIDNLSALINLMFSKTDVQQALGKISVNY